MLCNYKWHIDNRKLPSPPNFTLEWLQFQIHELLELVSQKLQPSLGCAHLDWDANNRVLPFIDSAANRIVPCITGLDIHKCPVSTYKQKQQVELCKLGETALDINFARQLKTKQVTSGLSYQSSIISITKITVIGCKIAS